MRIIIGILLLLILCCNGAFAEGKNTVSQQKAENVQNTSKSDPTVGDQCWWDGLDRNRYLLLVAVSQLVVFIWQSICLRLTVKATKESVDALKLSERPYIFVDTEVSFSDVANMEQVVTCSFVVRNLGKTPSIINFGDFKIMKIGEDDFSLSESGQVNIRKVCATGEGFNLSRSRSVPIECNKGKLFCYGKIIYKDIFGDEHITEFHHTYISNIEGFCVSDNKDLNSYT